MSGLPSIVAAFFLLIVPALAEQPVKGEVRDPSGKLLSGARSHTVEAHARGHFSD